MFWFLVYLLMAVIAASASFIWGGWVRERDQPAPLRPGWTALLIGLMWPVLFVGLVQVGLVVAVARWITARSRGRAGAATGATRMVCPLIW